MSESKIDKISGKLKKLIKEGKTQKELSDFISAQTSLKKSQCNFYAKQYWDNFGGEDSLKVNNIEEIECKERYVFNKETNQYVFFCKKSGKNIVLEASLVKRLLTCYSNFHGDESSISELSLKFNIPKAIVLDVLQCLGVTHDDLPLLPHELEELPVEELVEDLIQTKKFTTHQDFQKKNWQDICQKARKFEAIKYGVLNPFEDLLSTWEPPKVDFKLNKQNKQSDNKINYLIGVSDVHFGEHASQMHLYHSKNWTIEDTKRCVTQYLSEIKKDVTRRKESINKCVLVSLGDILDSVTGYTDKGTKLDTHPIGEEQWNTAFDSIYLFIKGLLEIFPKVEVHAASGNHCSFGDYALFKALEKIFHNIKSISFNVITQRWGNFKLDNSLFIFEHGYSAKYPSKVPRRGIPKDSYIQTVLLSKPELLVNTKQKYFLSADKHTFQAVEAQGFEHIQFSTLVGGNRFADNMNLVNRPRQNVLIVDKNGVREILNIYFD